MTSAGTQSLAILLVEDNPGDANLVREYLNDALANDAFVVHHCEQLCEALEHIGSTPVDVVLLDLGLPDSQGLETFARLHKQASDLPVIVLTGSNDMQLALAAVKAGAADFLTKGQIDGELLSRAIRYAIERQTAASQILEERNAAQRYLDVAGVMLLAMDRDGTVTLINKRGCEILGYNEEEILGKNWFENFVPQQVRDELISVSARLLTGDISESEYHENPILTRTGEERVIAWHNTPLADTVGNIIGHLSSGEDITERVKARRNRELIAKVLGILNRPNEWQLLIRDILDAIQASTGIEAVGIRLGSNGDFPYAAANGFPNGFLATESSICATDESGGPIIDGAGQPVLECMCGNVLRGRTDASLPFFTERGSFWTNSTTDLLASTTEEDRQSNTRNVCHAFGYESVALVPVQSGGETVGLVQLNDKRRNQFDESSIEFFEGLASSIGVAYKRQQSQAQIKQLLERQTHVNQLSFQLGHTLDLRATYAAVYRHVRGLMDTSAFIISLLNPSEKTLSASYVVTNGQEQDVSDLLPVPLAEDGQGMRSRVVQTRELLYVPDWQEALKNTKTRLCIHDDGSILARAATPNSEAEPDVTRSALLVPMQVEGRMLGVLQVQSDRLDAYEEADQELLAGLANVTAIALRSSELYREIEQDAVVLRASLEGTIRALADTTEARDPYTAGHQRRVAELSVAIAEEMGLSNDSVETVYMAGLVHDIGKIATPAEILTKPGKLSDVEFSLIKAHARSGFDILKGIDFPWPIAEVVLQHHERINGAGYPDGLPGDSIRLEASIIAVADVVEAMTNHRPYRAALGIDAALEEIEKRRGDAYNLEVADACITLFNERGFEFTE